MRRRCLIPDEFYRPSFDTAVGTHQIVLELGGTDSDGDFLWMAQRQMHDLPSKEHEDDFLTAMEEGAARVAEHWGLIYTAPVEETV